MGNLRPAIADAIAGRNASSPSSLISSPYNVNHHDLISYHKSRKIGTNVRFLLTHLFYVVYSYL